LTTNHSRRFKCLDVTETANRAEGLSEVDGKEWYHVEISNRFADLENLDTEVDVNKALESIRENI
jgi:hypothetical protein